MKPHILGWFVGIALGFLSPACHAFTITLFPAKEVFSRDAQELHRNLGLTEGQLIVEDFEDEKFIEGLNAPVKPTQASDLSPLVWDGARVAAIPVLSDFQISLPNVRLVGLGIGDNDGGGEEFSINDGPLIKLQTLPNHVTSGQGRAYYVLIAAEAGDADIKQITVKNFETIVIDHLMMRQEMADPKRPQPWVFDLVDGSRLVGSSSMQAIKIELSGKMIEIPVDRIAHIQPQPEKRMISMALRNGDTVTSQVEFDGLSLKTILGETFLGIEKIKKITIHESIQAKRRLEREGINAEAEHTLIQQELRRVERDLVMAKSLHAQYESLSTNLKRLPKAELRRVTPITSPDAMLTELQKKLAAAEHELAVQTKQAGPDHPKIVQLSVLITNLSAQIDAGVDGVVRGLEIQTKAQEARRAVLEQEKDRLRKQAADLMEKYRPYFQAKRDLEARQRIEETLKLRMLQERIDPSLPRASAPARGVLEVTVSKQEPYYYLGPRPLTLENLRQQLLARVKTNPQAGVTIKVETDVPTARLIELIDALRAAGIEARFGIHVNSTPRRESR